MRKREIVTYLENLGISKHDIAMLLALKQCCAEACEEISDECVLEGKPSHGYDYEIRCEEVCSYYTEEENEIFAKYGL